MVKSAQLSKPAKFIALTLLSLGLSLLLTEKLLVNVFNFFEERSYDFRYKYLISEKSGNDIPDRFVLVDIDEESLKHLGRFQQWPRSYTARVIENISRDRPAAILPDILFIERDREPQQDSLLVEATRKSGVVFNPLNIAPGSIDTEEKSKDYFSALLPEGWESITEKLTDTVPVRGNVSGPFNELAEASGGLGFTNLIYEGAVRSVHLFFKSGQTVYPSIALAIAVNVLGITPDEIKVEPGKFLTLGDRIISIDKRCRIFVKYLGKYQTFRYVPFYMVLNGMVGKGSFQDKIVIIGASSAGLGDLKAVPFDSVLPGMEIHATVLQNLLTGEVLTKTGKWTGFIIIALLIGFITLFSLYLRPLYSAIFLGFICMAYFTASYFTLETYGLWIELIRPEFSIILAFVVTITFQYATEEREKKRLRNIFRHYVNDDIISDILKNPDTLALGGKSIELSILFMDIESFTALSEGLEPEELVNLLNSYLGRSTDIILEHEGILDKYLGDGLMAVFGVAKPDMNHARAACLTALEIIRNFDEISIKMEKTIGTFIRSRIGIATGRVVAGNIGSNIRMEYTVIGDTVNSASRLEGLNKQFGTRIIISEATKNLAGDMFTTRELDRVRLRGKNIPLTSFELISDSPLSPKLQERVDIFEEALENYRKREFDNAIASFELLKEISPEDKALNVFIGRINHLKENPPPPSWTDGAWPIFDRRKAGRK